MTLLFALFIGLVAELPGWLQASGCFVVNATAWLDADQQAQIMKDTGCTIGPISGGCFTAIVAPDGTLLGEPVRSG